MNRIQTLGVLVLLTLTACSSTPSPDSSLAAGAVSVEAARAAGASEFAPVEMSRASTRLDRARALAKSDQREDAIRWAEQAQADARLAQARAESERSRRALEEVRASTQSLREELARPGARPTAPPQMTSPSGTTGR